MLTHNLGYPRIGSKRELKKVSEEYWSGKTTRKNLIQVAKNIRKENWLLQKNIGIDLIPSNDFSLYDQVLDMSMMVGAIPNRFEVLLSEKFNPLDIYYAMARGYQNDNHDIKAMEMTKWFDTNYHYIVPEFYEDQEFQLFSTKVIDEFYEAKELGILTKPVLIGPVSYILLGKEKEGNFDKIELIKKLIPVYVEVIKRLEPLGVEWIQFDEPFLGLDLSDKEKDAYKEVYLILKSTFPKIKIMIATYFEGVTDNISLIADDLLINALHIDLVRNPEQLEPVLNKLPNRIQLSLGIVDGRNIWKNEYQKSLQFIYNTIKSREKNTTLIAPSCSLLHSPCDLDLEKEEGTVLAEIKDWMAFAKQKLNEVVVLKELVLSNEQDELLTKLESNIQSHTNRRNSKYIQNLKVKDRVTSISQKETHRDNSFKIRKELQEKELRLPFFPTTTIGSFPQTKAVRNWRYKYKKGELSLEEYNDHIKDEIRNAIDW